MGELPPLHPSWENPVYRGIQKRQKNGEGFLKREVVVKRGGYNLQKNVKNVNIFQILKIYYTTTLNLIINRKIVILSIILR